MLLTSASVGVFLCSGEDVVEHDQGDSGAGMSISTPMVQIDFPPDRRAGCPLLQDGADIVLMIGCHLGWEFLL